jgi:hypothetical protein
MVSTAGGSGVTEVDSPNFTAIAGDTLIAVCYVLYDDLVPALSDLVGSNDTWTQIESGFTTIRISGSMPSF